ncbi:MAG: DUF4870 domain-containing protein [Phycisphaerales bacterium]|nr:DUF4870 domain-containing protein [Phycisphaerales bacterium]
MHDLLDHHAPTTADERTWATFQHLGGLIAWFVIGPFCFLVPLVMWLVKKDESSFLDDHGREALNFELSMLLYAVVLLPVAILTLGLGFLLYIPWAALGVVMPIVGAVAANKGRYYRYPACIRFIAPRY